MEKRSRTQAIHDKCLDCTCGSHSEAKNCTITNCALHPFRPGANKVDDKPKRVITEEHKQKLLNSARIAREAKQERNSL